MQKPSDFKTFQRDVRERLERNETTAVVHALAQRVLGQPGFLEYNWLARTLEQAVDGRAIPVPVGVLSTFTIESVRPLLRAIGFAHGLSIDPYFGGFQQLETEVLNPTSGLVRHSPTMVFFAWQLTDLAPTLWHSLLELSGEQRTQECSAVLARIRECVEGCRTNLPRAAQVLHTFVPPAASALGVLDFQDPRGHRVLVDELNAGLRDLAREHENVYLLDSEAVARQVGDATMVPGYFLRARAPLGPTAQVAFAQQYVSFARAVAGKTKKVVVVDLDNTMWGGVLGEDGIDGIRLGPDFPGNAFVAFQHELRQLSRRGVVLAINSKNNEGDVQEAFANHPHMVLALDEFAATRINWEDKAQNLRGLAEQLSLGLDSFVFVDDNPIELEIVQQQVPEVATVRVPDEPSLLPGLLSRSGYFDSVIYSEEDRKRTSFYRAEAGRQALQRATGDLEGFYRSLEMRLYVKSVGDAETPRVAQLTQRTNQFNMTTRRYSEADIRSFREDSGARVYCYRLTDRFGDNGIIAVIIVKSAGPQWEIDTFLMSCRVIGRTAETAMLALLAGEASAAGATALVGDVLPTKKNVPARQVYPDNQFEVAESLPDDGVRYRLSLPTDTLVVPEWIQVINEDGE